MSNYPRRRLIRDLAVVSASAVGLPLLEACQPRPAVEAPHPATGPSPNDLYVIFCGPWLLWMQGNTDPNMFLATIDFNDPNNPPVPHSYTYFDSLNPSAPPTAIPKDEPVSLQVNQYSAATDNSTVLQPMKAASQGLFFNTGVKFNPQSGMRQIWVPRPTWIRPAALMKGEQFTFDSSYMINPNVLEWPGALLFIYSGWQSAQLTIGATATPSFAPSGKPTHLEFRIRPENPPELDCDKPDVTHVSAYFAQLMTLLKFPPSAKIPTVAIPPCVSGVNPIQARSGDDTNVACSEIGMKGTCDNAYHPVQMLHGKDDSSAHPELQLVNCASGHGGSGGCC